MKYNFFTSLLLASAVSVSASAQSSEDIANKYPGYKLAFQDEFDKGSKPDPDIWNYEVGLKRNHEDQCYMEDNATISDGMLVIEARKERVKNPDYVRYSSDWKTKNQYCDYTSASIIAKDPNRFSYAIWEVRAKIPVGTGYWPAIWSTGSTYEWPYAGEIDVMEYYGDAIHANVAWGTNTRWNAAWSSQAPRMSTFEDDFADKFHIWRLEWTEEAIRIYLDDRLLNETMLDRTVNPNPAQDWYNVDDYNPYRDPNNKHGVWLNLALGGDNGGSLNNTVFPAQYLVDYVRVYVPDGIYSGIHQQLSKAQNALDTTKEGSAPGEFPVEARQALRDAMDRARALIDVADEAAAKEAASVLAKAIETYLASYNPIVAGDYRFLHNASGLMLSAGWKDSKNCIFLLPDNTSAENQGSECNQVFTLVPAPDGANVSGFNLKVGDNEYVYRDSWNLYVSDKPQLKTKNYIFNVEFDGDFVRIKNEGSGKYFGNDENEAWASMYSDKDGKGNDKSCFRLISNAPGAVDNIYAADYAHTDGIYNLHGLKVADSIDEAVSNGLHGIFIKVSDLKTKKIIL